MLTSSRRLRVEEKRLYKRLLLLLIFLVIGILLAVHIGLPLFAQLIVTITANRYEKLVPESKNNLFLFPPILEETFEATNTSRISLTGLGEKETTVKIFVNGKETTKVETDRNGKFNVANILLTEGLNNIMAKTLKDEAESTFSSPLLITYKKIPPKLEIIKPKDGEKFLEVKEITISGETDPDSKVTINDRFVIVNQYGRFNYKVTLSDGENKLKILAEDLAGNKTTVERRVIYNP